MLVNQQRSNKTRIKNAKTRRAQERCFTWVECTSECCKKWNWRVCKVNWCVVRAAAALRLARKWRQCEWEWWRHENGFKFGIRVWIWGRLGIREWDWELGLWVWWGMRARRQAGVIRGKGLGQVRTDFKRPNHSSHLATAWREVTSRQAAYQ